MENETSANARERIVEAAVAILASEGREAVSTRAVSAAAGVQAPTIYRLFGDKQGLLDAVAAHGFQAYLHTKVTTASGDPVEDLRRGFDLHVEFGLSNPALYLVMYGDFSPGHTSPAATAAADVLALHLHRIAEAGRLRLGEEQAAQLVHAAGAGVTLSMIATPEERRDPAVVARAREAVITAITVDEPVVPGSSTGRVATLAVALRAVLPEAAVLSPAEEALMREWLDRIATGIDAPGARNASRTVQTRTT